MILQKSMLIKLFFAYYWSCGSSGICLTMGKRIHHHDVQHRICRTRGLDAGDHGQLYAVMWPCQSWVAQQLQPEPLHGSLVALCCTIPPALALKSKKLFRCTRETSPRFGPRLKCFRISFRRGIHAVDSRSFSQSNRYCQLLSIQPRMENTLLVGMPMMKPCFKENIRIVASLLQAQ